MHINALNHTLIFYLNRFILDFKLINYMYLYNLNTSINKLNK